MIKTLSKNMLENQLRWRYATKKFDPLKKIPIQDWDTLEEALVLSPSSFGLQPWKFYVVTDPKVREKLKPASWDQSQITDASHLVVFTVKKNLNAADVEHFLQRIAEVRKSSLESLNGYKQYMLTHVNRKDPGFDINIWATKQVYIALGSFLTSAAVLGIDACPMEGFDPEKYDEILGLDKQGYHAVVVATAGYRAKEDSYASAPKVRFPKDEIIAHLS